MNHPLEARLLVRAFQLTRAFCQHFSVCRGASFLNALGPHPQRSRAAHTGRAQAVGAADRLLGSIIEPRLAQVTLSPVSCLLFCGFETTTMNHRRAPTSDDTGSKPASFISRESVSAVMPCMPSLPRSAGHDASLPGGGEKSTIARRRARLERPRDRRVHRRRIREVVVDVAHEHRVAARIREVRLDGVAGHDGDLRDAADFVPERLDSIVAKLARVDATLRADDARGGKRQLAIPRTHFARGAAIAQADGLEDLSVGDRSGALRRCRGRDEERDEQQNERSMTTEGSWSWTLRRTRHASGRSLTRPPWPPGEIGDEAR